MKNEDFTTATAAAAEEAAITFCAPEARVLLVDDDPTNLKVAQGLMSPYKMRIDTCGSGGEAIEAVRKNLYDIIFMDQMMPGIDGVSAAKIIRELNVNETASVPIIALTANITSGTKEMFLKNGLNDFLPKPIDVSELNHILEMWLPAGKRVSQAGGAIPVDISDVRIDGVDVELGIMRMGGRLVNYLKTLAVFTVDVRKKIAQIKEAFDDDDLPLYTTYVHALKSALANIGALAISREARFLEEAGKRGDREFIDDHNAKLLADIAALAADIEKMLAARAKHADADDIDPDTLKLMLAELKSAMSAINTAAIGAVARQLTPYEDAPEIGPKIREISQNVLNGDYEAAEKCIDAILG